MPVRLLISRLVVILALVGFPTTVDAAEVRWMWSGAPTPHSIRVKVKIDGGAAPALQVGRQANLADAREVPAAAQWPADGGAIVLDYLVSDLQPNTAYLYRVGQQWGKFHTLPEGPASFTIALGSCASTGSSHPVFTTIAAHRPLFFLHTGDLHYQDIAVNDVNVFRAAYDRVLSAVSQAALYRTTPVVYMWDDHDFGPNNSDSSSPSREASRLAYRENVPHFPLVLPARDAANYHAFSVGRVRFIVCDARSERSAPGVPEAERTMLGAEQKAWLKQELLAARDSHALIVWVNSVPWIGSDDRGEQEDRWTGFVREREELATFIADHEIANLCMVSGDAHMLAIDDGRNNRYARDGRRGFPIFQAAALDRPGSFKGGPYSHGALPGGGQFGLMHVQDTGGAEVRVHWSGRNYLDQEVLGHHFTVAATPIAGD